MGLKWPECTKAVVLIVQSLSDDNTLSGKNKKQDTGFVNKISAHLGQIDKYIPAANIEESDFTDILQVTQEMYCINKAARAAIWPVLMTVAIINGSMEETSMLNKSNTRSTKSIHTQLKPVYHSRLHLMC